MNSFIRCAKRSCPWVGRRRELVQGETSDVCGVGSIDLVCPRCGEPEYYFLKILDACEKEQREVLVYILENYYEGLNKVKKNLDLAFFQGKRVVQEEYIRTTPKLNSLAVKGVLVKGTTKGSIAIYRFSDTILLEIIKEMKEQQDDRKST